MKNSFNWKVYLPMILFLMSVVLLGVFSEELKKIVDTEAYIISNIILFLGVLAILFVFLAIWFKRFIFTRKGKNIDLKEGLFFLIIGLISLVLVFFVLNVNSSGRFLLSPLLLDDFFDGSPPEINRTYYSIIPSVLYHVFGSPMDISMLFMINKIFSFLFLLSIFAVSRMVFKNKWVSGLVFLTVVSSVYVQQNLFSMEHGIGALFFSYFSILFLISFVKNQDNVCFIISLSSLVIATLYRYELSFLLGLPYLLYISIFILPYNKKVRKLGLTLFYIVAFRLISVVFHFTNNDDPFLTGGFIQGRGVFPILVNSISILKNNIFLEKDLLLSSGYVSLFTYLGLFVSMFIVVYLVIVIKEGKDPNFFPLNIFSIFAFYNLVYFFFQMAFHIEGMRSGVKYSVNYFFCEVVLSYLLINTLISKLKRLEVRKIVGSVFLILFFILSFFSSQALSFDMLSGKTKIIDIHHKEMLLLKERVDLQRGCSLIKISPGQPLVDYSYGTQKDSKVIGDPPLFYILLEKLEKEGKCFYYYDQNLGELYSEGEKIEQGIYEGYRVVDLSRVDDIFGGCKREVLAKVPFVVYRDAEKKEVLNELIRYDC